MNIMVVGCTPTGCQLVRELQNMGHELSVIAQNEAEVDALHSTPELNFSGLVTVGKAIDVDVLRNAGVANMDALAAVTESDNVNVMVCQIARELFSVHPAVASISDAERGVVFGHQLNMDAISPPELAAQAFVSSLTARKVGGSLTLGTTTLNFTYHTPAEHLLGHPAAEYPCPEGCYLFGIQKPNGEFIPNAAAGVLEQGDEAVLYRLFG